MKKKLILLLVIVLVTVTVFAGCGGAVEIKRPEPDKDIPVFNVTGSCKAELNGNVLTVSGQTNLMDGTNGIIGVYSSDGTRVDQKKFTKQGDNLTAEFEVKVDWPETVYGNIMFDTQKSDGQPDEVKKTYGKHFQNLDGEGIIWDKNGNIVIFQSEAVTIK